MTDSFFAFRSLDEEVTRKVASLERPASDQFAELLLLLRQSRLPSEELQQLQALYAKLADCPFDSIYPNYLSHPVRLAASFHRLWPEGGARAVALALCHNFRETAVAGQDEIEREFLDADQSRCLDLMFTDRAREKDPAYLAAYYDGIASGPARLMVLKGLDKVDNFLSYVLYDIDAYHKQVVTDWVLPRLAPVDARLSRYLGDVVDHVFDPAVKQSYQNGRR